MQPLSRLSWPAPGPTTLNLDEPDAVQRARTLPPSAWVHIDCGRLVCQRTLGVAYVVSQLLLLRRAGTRVWLRNVNAPLRRCLQLLRVSSLFRFDDLRTA